MTSDTSPTLSIVSVLYGGQEVLHDTLASWRRALGPRTEVVFIDHSPKPLAAELDLDAWSRYEWNPDNPGFAAGVNRGVALASADRVFLLNPDVYLTGEALAEIAAAEADGPMTVALRTAGVEHHGIEYSWWGFCKDRVDLRRPLVGASGGAALFPRSLVLEEVPFPEHLFAWGEDAEWSLRLRAEGVVTTELRGVVLDHVGGHSVASRSGQQLKARLLVRNRIATYRRALSPSTKAVIAVPFFAAIVLNGVRKIAQGVGPHYLRGIVEGVRMELPRRDGATISWTQWSTLTKRTGRSA